MGRIEKVVTTFLGDPWFSSLWTLQEFILRPDAVLLDKHGDSLTVPREDIALLVDRHDREDALLTLEALRWALSKAQAEGRDLQQSRVLLQDESYAINTHILELANRVLHAIQKCGCGSDFIQGSSNPNIQFSAAKFRKTTYPEDRVYAISQIYNIRVGQSARPAERPPLDDLIEKFALAINAQSPVLGQLFVHTRKPEVGRSWCITEHSDVPDEMEDIPALVHLMSTIARDDSGVVVVHGPSCDFGDLCDVWALCPDSSLMVRIHLDEHIRGLVDPACAMSSSNAEGYRSRLLACFRQGVRVVLLGDHSERPRESSQFIHSFGLLLEQILPCEAPGDRISCRRLGLCTWTAHWGDTKNLPFEGGVANPSNIPHMRDIKSRNGIPLRALHSIRPQHASDVNWLFSEATRMIFV